MQPQSLPDLIAAFLEVSNAVNNSSSLAQVLETTCRKAVELTNVDHSAMALFDEAYQKATVEAEYGPNFPVTLGTPISLKDPIEVRLLKDRDPIVIDNINRPEWKKELGRVFD